MQDRVPLYPGRVTLTPVDGLTNTYDMSRADEPTQEGTPLNKATFLKDSTASLIGLPNSALPDDALIALAIGVGYYGFRIKVLLSNGEPAEGLKIEGIMSLDGSDVYTDYNGVAFGKSKSPATISIISPFVDQKNLESTVIEPTGTITDTTISLLGQTDIIEIAESKTVKLSQTTTSVDITAVGGGGGGGGGSTRGTTVSTAACGGGGGGGGYVTTSLGNSTLLLSELIIIIGAGGSAGGISNQVGTPGTDGGATSVQLLNSNVITALGGSGGKGKNLTGSRGGSGNGNGGGWNSQDKTMEEAGNGTGYIFNDSSLGLAGGGGGGGGDDTSVKAGGAPYGGAGAYYKDPDTPSTDSTAGTGFGGGGGGGMRFVTASNGASGGVYLRFHF